MQKIKRSRIGFLKKIKLYRKSLKLANSQPKKRLQWKQMEPQGGNGMVKGLSKRVVVVKSPDPKIFEEAIFIVREDYFSNTEGVSSEELIKEAQRVANYYARNQVSQDSNVLSKLPAPLLAAAGAAVTGIAWLAMRLVGV